jgi:type III secretion protein R
VTPLLAGSALPALPGDRPVELLLLLGALALAPVALVTLTSFLKVAVVLSILRSALGTPQVPPGPAVTGLALLVTLLVMRPVADACWERLREEPAPRDGEAALRAAARAAEPLRAFLARFARADDRRAFAGLAARARRPAPPPPDDDLSVLAPAFVVSELRRAFTVGFLVFLPFLVVDLAVANVLLALGLTQVSPTAVALPFKLLLVVAVDGVGLLVRGLAAGYLA